MHWTENRIVDVLAHDDSSRTHFVSIQSYRQLRHTVIGEIRKYNKKIHSLIDKYIPLGKWWRIVISISKLINYEPPPPLKSKGKLFFHPAEKSISSK